MTDKKIMADETTINSVDVSKCAFLNTDRNPYYATCDAYNGACSDNRHCYYKSLRRKTAECEELKKAAFTLAKGLNFRQKVLDEIEKYCNKFGQNSIGFRKNILDIINKAKDGEE